MPHTHGTPDRVVHADDGTLLTPDRVVHLDGGTGGSTVHIQDEGIAQGVVDTLNLVGAGVTVSVVGNIAIITIPGGGGASSDQLLDWIGL